MNKFVIGINKVIVIFLKQYFYNRKEHKSNFFTSFLGLKIKSASYRIYQYIYLNGYFCGYSVDELDCCWQTIFSSDYANIPPSSSLSFISLLFPPPQPINQSIIKRGENRFFITVILGLSAGFWKI